MVKNIDVNIQKYFLRDWKFFSFPQYLRNVKFRCCSQILHNFPPDPNKNITIATKYFNYFCNSVEIFCATWKATIAIIICFNVTTFLYKISSSITLMYERGYIAVGVLYDQVISCEGRERKEDSHRGLEMEPRRERVWKWRGVARL